MHDERAVAVVVDPHRLGRACPAHSHRPVVEPGGIEPKQGLSADAKALERRRLRIAGVAFDPYHGASFACLTGGEGEARRAALARSQAP